MKKPNILIIGTGIAGLSVAYNLKKQGYDFEIFDKSCDNGGLLRSLIIDDFTFDIGGHVLHARTKDFAELMRNLLQDNLIEHRRNASIFVEKNLVPYPFQAYFYLHPSSKLVEQCWNGLLSADGRLSTNFKNWILNNFGSGIAEYFMIPYNEKLWHAPLEDISLEWVKRYVPKPNSKEIIELAQTNSKPKFGYNVKFLYPKIGGIQAFIKSFMEETGIKIRKGKLIKVNLTNKKAYFSNGKVIDWDVLVTSIPLPSFIGMTEGDTKRIMEYSKLLRWISLYTFNFGVRGKIPTNAHWMYFPELEFPFHRLVFQSNLSPQNAPNDCYSMIVETSVKPYEKPKFWINSIIDKLIKIKLIPSKDDIILKKVIKEKYGYVVYDHNWKKSRKRILEYLQQKEVFCTGRFGCWQYFSIEDSFLHGKKIAENIIENIHKNYILTK